MQNITKPPKVKYESLQLHYNVDINHW